MTEKHIAELVDQLFKTHLKEGGKEYTYSEVASALQGEVDASYLGKLRSGKVPNPSRNVLKNLCLFFRVPAAFFFPELESLIPPTLSPDEQLQAALRATDIEPEAQASIQALVKSLQAKRK